jgi:hypothetical protein
MNSFQVAIIIVCLLFSLPEFILFVASWRVIVKHSSIIGRITNNRAQGIEDPKDAAEYWKLVYKTNHFLGESPSALNPTLIYIDLKNNTKVVIQDWMWKRARFAGIYIALALFSFIALEFSTFMLLICGGGFTAPFFRGYLKAGWKL